MKLQQQLDKIRQGFERQAPPEAVALIHRVTEDLRNSGITDGVLKVKQTAPSFELENSHGIRTKLSELLVRGPVVLTFFRGHW